MKYRTLIIAALILALAAGAVAALYHFRPTTTKIKPQPPVPLVSARALVPSSEKIFIETFGTVIPARQIELFAEVEGRILAQSPELVPGGLLRADSFVARLDPSDYQLRVRERQADLVEAESKLALEKGQQIIASREWQLFTEEGEGGEVNERLALREPHLNSALAQLEAARSRLDAAHLAEQRTTITAPFNALVLERFVEKGQVVGRQSPIAKLVDTDCFWVQVSVAPADLARITFADGVTSRGSAAQVVLPAADNSELVRPAAVFKLLGDLDPKGRMARILVAVRDPLNLRAPGAPGAILLGSYVKVRIEAGSLEEVYVIPRKAIRDNDRLWVLTGDNTLAIRPAMVRWRRQDELLVHADLAPGDRIITSRLQSALPGMALRTENGN
jgi:RND family efflux transporter MFP subunit